MNKINHILINLIILTGLLFTQSSVLDDYVNNIDPYTGYTLESTEVGLGYTSHILNLTSQKWLTDSEVDHPIWQHWIVVIVPWEVNYETAFLLINGGGNDINPPDPTDEEYLAFAYLAVESKSVMALLETVPNQPLMFSDEDFTRTEDEIIAYSWEKYLTTGDPKWPLNIPMTKSAVTAMDAIQDYCAEIPLFPVTINDFFVSGGSKRGWTTFLTAAVDDRVMAIAPIVFDALNLVNSFRLHYASYGEWSPAVHDYEDMGVFNYFTEPIVQDLMQIVDPFVYRERLTMPKYMLAATGDEFFVPAAQNYLPDLVGEKHMAYFPNTGHGFSEEEANLLQNLFVFYQAALDNVELPDYSWERLDDGSIEIICETQPSEVNLWQAVNPAARDFRDYVVGDPWTSTPLTDQGGGVYIAEAILPDEGWRGMFVELQFDLGYDYPFMVTTEVSIFPDDLPFGVDVTLSVIDHSNEYLGFNVSGQLTYYETVPFSDDGVEGDVLSDDDIWTATISATPDGEYNWHLYGLEADGTYSLISSAENLVVIVSGSNITGDLEYNIVSEQNGDVNLDGQINIQDVIISVNITLGIYEPSTEQFEMADINNDGIVNVLDIIQLVNIILGN
ncbi:MAG: PhoPQ-activated protein PqaA family protein [Candidatus Marinimicrobia bacterium]|nr:PhoPQ-activated protein PqaA family protein [Candidatus Neomarinimicrobiota bacterium]